MTLIDLKDGQGAVIDSVIGGAGATKRLADLGLTPKTKIRILRKAPFGPLEIEARGAKMVLGRGLALKIIVKIE